MPVKVKDLLQVLEQNGWVVVRQKGSHRQLKHPEKSDLVTVAGKPGAELRPGTLNAILKKAGLK